MALIKIFGQKVCVVKKFAISIHGIDSAKSREACDYYDYDFASSFLVVNSDTSMTGKTSQSYPSLSLSSSLSLSLAQSLPIPIQKSRIPPRYAENTHLLRKGSITVRLTSGLTDLDSTKLVSLI